MNLLLLEPEELRQDGTARLGGRRARHVREVLGAAVGSRIRAGLVGGRLGEAEVLAIGEDELVLSPHLDQEPPPPVRIQLLVALPRPKVLRRMLQAIASMGVKRLVLCGSYRVERSYFSSPLLAPEALRAELLLGLEQGRDTILPRVEVRRLFKPLVEDELGALLPAPIRLLADPGAAAALPEPTGGGAALAIGPEGGFTSYEAGMLQAHGFVPFSLGPRVLRVDTAVSFAAGRVMEWMGRRSAGT
jgi:16S rRNA (uracil1498-N3)-methyltransferase